MLVVDLSGESKKFHWQCAPVLESEDAERHEQSSGRILENQRDI